MCSSEHFWLHICFCKHKITHISVLVNTFFKFIIDSGKIIFYIELNCSLFRKVKDKNMEKLSLEKKAELFDKFIRFYAKDVPFGSMPKTNTDAFIYGLLEETRRR